MLPFNILKISIKILMQFYGNKKNRYSGVFQTNGKELEDARSLTPDIDKEPDTMVGASSLTPWPPVRCKHRSVQGATNVPSGRTMPGPPICANGKWESRGLREGCALSRPPSARPAAQGYSSTPCALSEAWTLAMSTARSGTPARMASTAAVAAPWPMFTQIGMTR